MMEPPNPMNDNWNIVGHTWAVDMLRQHVSGDAARHAYLFTGPRGVGRRTLALRFAQALNCATPGALGIPCGDCYHCTRFETDISKLLQAPSEQVGNGHPDLRIIEPVTKDQLQEKDKQKANPDSKPDEGQQGRGPLAIRVEQVRREREKISLRPYVGRFRVLIFVRFEEATPGASSALLKTLEEAPAHAVLILTAESPEGLLPTIVSRCEVLRLHPVPLNAVQQLLEQRGAQPDQARLLSHVSGGCPGAAIRLMEDKEALADRDEKLNDLLALLPATRVQKFAYAEKLGKDKAGMRGVLMLWLSFWRDVMWRAGGASTEIANIDRQPEIDALALRTSLANARQLVADLDRGLRRLESNVNPRLLAEVLLLDWPH